MREQGSDLVPEVRISRDELVVSLSPFTEDRKGTEAQLAVEVVGLNARCSLLDQGHQHDEQQVECDFGCFNAWIW